ncbi:YdcH family protein [bacterium]|nr:YdcH family protein [bacterium]
MKSHLIELERKHKELDTELEVKYNNMTVTDEVRKMKTMKLYLKDEIHRINARLIQLGLE